MGGRYVFIDMIWCRWNCKQKLNFSIWNVISPDTTLVQNGYVLSYSKTTGLKIVISSCWLCLQVFTYCADVTANNRFTALYKANSKLTNINNILEVAFFLLERILILFAKYRVSKLSSLLEYFTNQFPNFWKFSGTIYPIKIISKLAHLYRKLILTL